MHQLLFVKGGCFFVLFTCQTIVMSCQPIIIVANTDGTQRSDSDNETDRSLSSSPVLVSYQCQRLSVSSRVDGQTQKKRKNTNESGGNPQGNKVSPLTT